MMMQKEDEVKAKDVDVEVLENDTKQLLDIIDMQIYVISSMSDVDANMYDDIEEQKIRAVGKAMKLIMKVQDKLMKDL